jgi:NAD(P)-dependent dehydrogenase (short-subunit alcohol dehydrogenase family)
VERFEDRVVVVTGGGSGIGRGAALAFAARGARVVVADIDAARAAAVRGEIVSRVDRPVLDAVVDVTSLDDLEALRDRVLSQFGRVDVIMNNVGVLAVGLPEAIPVDAWEHVLDVNVLSIARSLQVFLPTLLAQGDGHIVNTASTAGLYTYAFDRMPYAASKAAIVSISEQLAVYLLPKGIGVTCVCPGPVRTNIVEQIRVFGAPAPVQAPALALLRPEDVGAMVVDAVRDEQFLVLTHPEVHDILVGRAEDPEGFVRHWAAELAGE